MIMGVLVEAIVVLVVHTKCQEPICSRSTPGYLTLISDNAAARNSCEVVQALHRRCYPQIGNGWNSILSLSVRFPI